MDCCAARLSYAEDADPADHVQAKPFDQFLFFDGPKLRVSRLAAARPGETIDQALARLAPAPPGSWDLACDARLVSLAEGRVGQDFWEIGEGEEQQFRITRYCGSAAKQAARAVTRSWACGGDGQCVLAAPPGNWDMAISYDRAGRLLGSGDISSVTPDQASHLRSTVPCGGHQETDEPPDSGDSPYVVARGG